MTWNECLPLKLAVWAVPRAVLHLLRAHCGAQGCSRFSSSFHRDTASHSQNVTNNKYVHLTSFRANARVTHSNTWFQHPTLIRRCICWKAYLKPETLRLWGACHIKDCRVSVCTMPHVPTVSSHHIGDPADSGRTSQIETLIYISLLYWNSHFRKRHYKAAASDCHRSALQCKSLNIEPTEPRLSQGSGSEEVKINVAAWCCLFHLVPNLHRIFGKVAACLSTPYSQLWRRVFQADHAFS